jgi:transposase
VLPLLFSLVDMSQGGPLSRAKISSSASAGRLVIRTAGEGAAASPWTPPPGGGSRPSVRPRRDTGGRREIEKRTTNLREDGRTNRLVVVLQCNQRAHIQYSSSRSYIIQGLWKFRVPTLRTFFFLLSWLGMGTCVNIKRNIPATC